MKGGYKIIDFKNVSLSGTPVTMADVLVDLLNNYDKVVLLSHVVLLGSAKDDCFSTVLSDGAGGVKLNCYDGYISINSSGAVTYTVASASGMAKDIANLQSTQSLTPVSSKATFIANNTRIKKANNCVIGIMDLTFESDVTTWDAILNIGLTFPSTMAVPINVYNVTDDVFTARLGSIAANGNLSTGMSFVNGKRYQILIAFII